MIDLEFLMTTSRFHKRNVGPYYVKECPNAYLWINKKREGYFHWQTMAFNPFVNHSRNVKTSDKWKRFSRKNQAPSRNVKEKYVVKVDILRYPNKRSFILSLDTCNQKVGSLTLLPPPLTHPVHTYTHTAFLNFCATHFTSQGQVYELQCKIFPWKYEKSGGLCDSCLRWIQSKACFSESWYGKKWVFRCCCWELILNGERARVESRFLWNFTIFPKIRGHIIIDVFLMKDTCFEMINRIMISKLVQLLKIGNSLSFSSYIWLWVNFVCLNLLKQSARFLDSGTPGPALSIIQSRHVICCWRCSITTLLIYERFLMNWCFKTHFRTND